ncbi:YqaJ viral recombinase family protein [Nonomuraea sp. NBC_01738]|uniref:YqaJ viral recombinase family nuclease n=1 Tax=Nonomuraea sp. NBC_01738 TaxID=2976003 RepID=UPI002E1385BB|nr:YqaJ viral recombinase family protein [Nonomuraea sp. NBC_01738]
MTITLPDLVTPTGRLILPGDAPRPQWLAARRRGIGGSDALAVLGLSPYGSRYSVWADKSGRLREQDDNEPMFWGRRLEPILAEEFTARTGIEAAPCGLMANVDRPWQLASVDRLTADGGVLEIKTTSAYKASDWDAEQIADAAEAQLQHYLAVTGLEHGYAAALIGGQRLEIRHVQRDERLIQMLIEAEAELWQMVLDGTPPALDGSDASLAALAEIYPTAADRRVALDAETVAALRRYDAWCAEETALKKAKQAAKASVCGQLRDGTTGTFGGVEVVTWKNTGSFDEDAFTAALPDIAAACQKSVLDVQAVKARHPELYAAYRGRRFHVIKKGLQ